MRIWVQKSASMQKRTSPLKFGDLAEKSGLNSVSNLSTKTSSVCDGKKAVRSSLCATMPPASPPTPASWAQQRLRRLTEQATAAIRQSLVTHGRGARTQREGGTLSACAAGVDWLLACCGVPPSRRARRRRSARRPPPAAAAAAAREAAAAGWRRCCRARGTAGSGASAARASLKSCPPAVHTARHTRCALRRASLPGALRRPPPFSDAPPTLSGSNAFRACLICLVLYAGTYRARTCSSSTSN